MSHAAQHRDVIFVLDRKINNRENVPAGNPEVINEACVFAIEILTSLVDGVPTLVERDMQVDWEAWGRFSNDLNSPKNVLRFDERQRKFVIDHWRLRP